MTHQPAIEEAKIAVDIPHLDAFAIILLAMNPDYDQRTDDSVIAYALMWLERWPSVLPGLSGAGDELTKIVYEEFPALAAITGKN